MDINIKFNDKNFMERLIYSSLSELDKEKLIEFSSRVVMRTIGFDKMPGNDAYAVLNSLKNKTKEEFGGLVTYTYYISTMDFGKTNLLNRETKDGEDVYQKIEKEEYKCKKILALYVTNQITSATFANEIFLTLKYFTIENEFHNAFYRHIVEYRKEILEKIEDCFVMVDKKEDEVLVN